MEVTFTAAAWQDYLYWQKMDKRILRRINELIKETIRHPFDGKGKPEALRFALAGFWSRRIDQEHRLVYKVIDSKIIIISVRRHYSNYH